MSVRLGQVLDQHWTNYVNHPRRAKVGLPRDTGVEHCLGQPHAKNNHPLRLGQGCRLTVFEAVQDR